MNPARWVVAHQMMMMRERREIKQWARFLGVDMTAFQKDADGNPIESETAEVFPLAGLVNPEIYNELVDRRETTVFEDEIGIEQYEKQIREMEKRGFLTEIDEITAEADKKVEDKKKEPEEQRLKHVLTENDSLSDADRMAQEAEKRVAERRREREERNLEQLLDGAEKTK